MSDRKAEPQVSEEDDLKRKLLRRVAFAGLMIAMLLGALALIDHLGQPGEPPEATGPTFNAPVPVAKKEVTQPVKPVESLPEVVKDGGAEAGANAARDGAQGTPAAPAAKPAESPMAEVPARPDIAAQPVLPAPDRRTAGVPSRPAPPVAGRTSRVAEAPAEGTSSASMPLPRPAAAPAAQETPAAQALPPPRPARAVAEDAPAPPRLFSGYAVQAGVFSDAQHAEELRAKLTLNGIPSTLEARVQLGPFKSRAEAEEARQKLKAIGVEGILLPPKGSRR